MNSNIEIIYKAQGEFFPQSHTQSSPDFGRMINSKHTKRVAALIAQDKVVMGGEVDTLAVI